MSNQTFKYFVTIALAAALVLILGVSVSAQEMMQVAGKINSTYTDKKEVDIGDVEGHKIMFISSEGTNTSTGDNAFLDGAKIMNYSMGELIMGNGPQQGYIKILMGEDGAICKWEHEVVTKMSAEGKAMTSFQGTFAYTGGMGKYAGIEGSGTYKGVFTSETEYTVDWQGEYSLGE